MIFPATTTAGGECFAMPDACKTPAPPAPPPPIPYPNKAEPATASPGTCSSKVLIESKLTCTLMTQIPQSSGDEAGSAGGVVSGMNMGPCTYKSGSNKVLIEGNPIVHLTSMTAHNGTNANMPAGAQISPSQTKVLVSP